MKKLPNKKAFRLILFSFIIIPTIISCSKEKQIVIGNNWQIESLKIHADSALQYPVQGKFYTLTFEDKHRYSLTLDVNTCSGAIEFSGKNTINFGETSCTKICCDSDFANNIVETMSVINQYDATDAALVLTGDQKIINLIRK